MSLTAQTVVVKPALDRPLSPKLEEFLTDICWRLQEMPDKPRMTLQDFADALRTKFKLGVPLMPQLHKFLAEMGVGLEWRDKAKGLDGSFDYDPIQGRWVIYIPADLGLRESFVIMHEVFELVSWRCYHRIGRKASLILIQRRMSSPFSRSCLPPSFGTGRRSLAMTSGDCLHSVM